MESQELAKCRGCGGKLRHPRIVVGAEVEGETFSYLVPSWHAECIPEHLKSGQQGIRRGRGRTSST